MSTNRTMHAGSWTKLTLTELKDLCAACGFSVEGNKEELGERLHAYFDKRKDKGPEAQSKGSSKGQEQGPAVTGDRTGEVVDVDSDDDGGGEDELDEDSQEADNRIREEFATRFRGKEKVSSVPVDVFLTALSSIERKMDKSFSALYREIEEGDSLEEAWPKVKLSKPRDQYEYDFLAKIGRRLDKVIRMLPDSVKKEVVSVRDEVESRAVTLRLADDRGWGAALQIVGSSDKMMEKYKDRIPVIGQAVYHSRPYARGYNRNTISEVRKKRKERRPFGVGIFMDPSTDREILPATTAESFSFLYKVSGSSNNNEKPVNEVTGRSLLRDQMTL
ncbi:5340_t:CDS:2 [Dentiscutata heterogama]|uniref:5340_t:CDS:1 n=1 Tax=Dentiscutata heterogama TaxID=1316150 RepID=A0ACA9KXE0_9GLOM|nr:5340_t:CDS:2 [Dentiscutata heterogama]